MRDLLRHRADRRALRAFAERQQLVKAGLTRRDLMKMGLMTTGGVGGGLVLADKSLAGRQRTGRAARCRRWRRSSAAGRPARAAAGACRDLTPAPGERAEPRDEPGDRPAVRGPHGAAPVRGPVPAAGVLPDADGREPEREGPPGPAGADALGLQSGRRGPQRRPADLTGAGPRDALPEPTIVRRHNAFRRPGRTEASASPRSPPTCTTSTPRPTATAGRATRCSSGSSPAASTTTISTTCSFAGWNSTNPPAGNIQEALGFLWYHDHRVDHTAENTYKGLVGPAIAFNEFDTGDESTGFHLPGFPDFDIPLVFADRLFDPRTGLLAFDTFNTDGILGNVFLVNGKVQPFFEVSKRRYRFRLLDRRPVALLSSSS